MKKMLAGGICLIAITFFGFKILAYDTNLAHPHLTREITKFYSYNFPDNKLLIEEMEWLARGSREEDKPPRYVNHFYNPLTNEQWLGANPIAVTAKDWANNRDLQKISVGGDQTFEEAIYQYRDGNKRAAFIALGHILHLIEDMTVPEHTRNDTHIPGPDTESPYETWSEKFVKNNQDKISEKLTREGENLSSCFSLENCFDEAAYYSNGYFFSIDSVEKFENPKIISIKSEINNLYGLGIDRDGKEYKLLKFITDGNFKWRNFNEIKEYELDNDVLSDYYERLSRKSIVVGAKVIKLFFDEIAYREANNIPNIKPLSWFDKFSNKIKSLFGFLPLGSKKTIAVGVEQKEGNMPDPQEEQQALPPVAPQEQAPETPALLLEDTGNDTSETFTEENNPIRETFFVSENSMEQNASAETPTLTPLQQAIATYGEGFGGFYAPPNPPPAEDKNTESAVEEKPEETSAENNQPAETANPELEQNATTTEEIVLPENPVEENATSTEELPEEQEEQPDQEGETNASSTKITGTHIVISEIKISGVENGEKDDEFVELYNSTDSDISLSGWKLRPFSKSGNAKSYLLRPFPETANIKSKGYYLISHEEYKGAVSTDSLYSTKESLADDNGLILYNAEGNIVDIVGWGDLKSPEIYETSSAPEIPDGSSLERKANENSTVGSMISGGADEFVGNEYDSDNNLNDFILRGSSDPQNSNSEKELKTVLPNLEEEIEEPEEPAEEPRPELEPELELEPEVQLGPTPLYGKISNTTLTLSPRFNPYVVNADFVVEKTAKLIIEPGVVIKFGKEFQGTWMKFSTILHIAGSLEVNGTEEKPVIFTSILDDTFAGDTNSDGESSVPLAGDWGAVVIESEADQTIDISYAKFFYGGAGNGTVTNNAVFVSRGGAVANLSDCYFSDNKTAVSNFGWKNTLSQPINVTRTLIENNRDGIIVDVFAPIAIQRSTIRNNQQYGIYLEAYSSEVFFMEESNIYENGKYGLWNFYGSRLRENGLKLADIVARRNWWGDASGPLASWKTNKVKEKIDFSEWLIGEFVW